jgi:hypothetical protein
VNGWFSSRFLWSRRFRLIGYWAVVAAVVVLGYGLFGRLPARELFSIIAAACRGDTGRVSTEAFALSLATIIFVSALGVGAAHMLFHWFFIWRSVAEARALVRSAKTKADFMSKYDLVYDALSDHPLVGHSWKEFDETLVKTGGPIRNTLRPQTFFNIALLKDRLVGLKFMTAIPGYFVGLGLLLTFVGLVIALSKAGMATSAAQMDGAGTGAEAMQRALRELLQAASFKFSTSIAGLGSSILLSLFFRCYTIGVESSLASFCEALEEKLDYVAPQSVTLIMVEQLEAQLAELKAINSEQFFSRLGQEVAPSIHGAMQGVIAPLVDRVGAAVDKLSTHSQSGMEDLLDRFTQNLQLGAGAELRDLSATLQSLQGALEQTRSGLSGSGEEFARHMSGAAENLNRLVLEAGQSLGRSSEQNRETLEQVVASLQATFETANARVERELANAASGASDRLESSMSRVLAGLEAQVSSLQQTLGGFQDGATKLVDDAQRRVEKAQEQSIEAMTRASSEAMERARMSIEGSGENFARSASGVSDRLEGAMSRVLAGLEGQVAGLQQTLGGFQDGTAKFLDETQSRVERAQAQSIEKMTRASVEAMEHARITISGSGEDFARAASGASDRLESAMSQVLAGLEGQVAGLQQTLGGFQTGAAKFLDETQSKVAEAQAQSVEAITRAAANAAAALEKGLTELLRDMRKEIDAMVVALNASEGALTAQSRAIDLAAVRSRESAEAFGQSAEAIRAAVDPVTRSNEALSGATRTMAEAIERSIASLNESQTSARALSESLERHSERVIETWRQYEARFGKVDDDLAAAFEKLANETSRWRETVADYTIQIDSGLSKSVDQLQGFLHELSVNAEDMSNAAQDMKEAIRSSVREPS